MNLIPSWQTNFPAQRVSGAEKQKPDWYANCIDFIISAGLGYNDRQDTERQLDCLHGNMPNEFYKKTLNPYNANKEKYMRFPATLRNYDIMNDIVRRYVSEYFKGVHEFIVGANNPDIVINKNAKLKEAIMQEAEQAFQQEFQKRYKQMVDEATQQGQPAESVDPSQAMPDVKKFMDDFNRNYIDTESKQGQDVLGYIRSMTDDNLIYLSAYFNFVALGECYTYTDIRGDKIVKECIPVTEAYPVPNANFFVEDHDMFARKMMMSYQQIVDFFGDNFSKKDQEFLETYYAQASANHGTTLLYSKYFETYPDVCDKFTKEERDFFRKSPINMYQDNTMLYEVWHVVWKGEARRGILTYVNQIGMQTTRVVDENYILNPEEGDIDIEWNYEPQVYEGYRIGSRYTAIYPIKARPIAFNRGDGKLPYNGIMEILPFMGQFSIVKIILPYQILRNIIYFHREMVIAKNKMLILLLPESLVASDSEDKIYKMAADGILFIDDSEDTNSLKAQQVRLLNANMGQYITELTNLIENIKQEARELVDMNAQRYGQIAQSAGATTTQNAIAQSSMGSVVINQMFDEFRVRDYNRDLDYAKLAYIDGLNTSYWDELARKRYISLDVNSFINSEYSTTVRNDSKEVDKVKQLRQWAFSAAQNGDLDMALAAIIGDNVTQIKETVQRFTEIKQQHEEQMKQMDQMLKQEEIQNKLQEIAAKGEQDRLTQELKYQYEMQLKGIELDAMISSKGDDDTNIKSNLTRMVEDNKRAIEQSKLNVERQKLIADTYSKAADRQVKMHEIDTNLKIAKTNKNKYDK